MGTSYAHIDTEAMGHETLAAMRRGLDRCGAYQDAPH